jgi:hypothetical protein
VWAMRFRSSAFVPFHSGLLVLHGLYVCLNEGRLAPLVFVAELRAAGEALVISSNAVSLCEASASLLDRA